MFNLEPMNEWTCPRPSCGEVIKRYGPSTLTLAIEAHVSRHELEAIRAGSKFAGKNYDRLELTRMDKDFLTTMGIKVEE